MREVTFVQTSSRHALSFMTQYCHSFVVISNFRFLFRHQLDSLLMSVVKTNRSTSAIRETARRPRPWSLQTWNCFLKRSDIYGHLVISVKTAPVCLKLRHLLCSISFPQQCQWVSINLLASQSAVHIFSSIWRSHSSPTPSFHSLTEISLTVAIESLSKSWFFQYHITKHFDINNRTERENCVWTPSGSWTNYASSVGWLNYLHMLVQIECELKIQFHELSSHVYTHFKRIKKAFISDRVFMSCANNKFLHSSESSCWTSLPRLIIKMLFTCFTLNAYCSISFFLLMFFSLRTVLNMKTWWIIIPYVYRYDIRFFPSFVKMEISEDLRVHHGVIASDEIISELVGRRIM